MFMFTCFLKIREFSQNIIFITCIKILVNINSHYIYIIYFSSKEDNPCKFILHFNKLTKTKLSFLCALKMTKLLDYHVLYSTQEPSFIPILKNKYLTCKSHNLCIKKVQLIDRNENSIKILIELTIFNITKNFLCCSTDS